MHNLTKMKIHKPATEVFEAIVDPAEMSNYWFSFGSARLEKGKTVTWRYEEYNAQVDIKVLELEPNRKIVYQWGATETGNVVTITLQESSDQSTIIEVNEVGFQGTADELLPILLDNKEGWVYMLTCLKGYLEAGINYLRASLVK